jgi:hypothetical protein
VSSRGAGTTRTYWSLYRWRLIRARENGEFHTLGVDGPRFAHPLDVTVGETAERDGFVFTDVVPTTLATSGRDGTTPG